MSTPTGRPSSYCGPGDDDPSLASVNMMMYSHPGEGKTVVWGTGDKDVCFLVSDPEGIVSARSLGYKPHSIQCTDYEELQEAYDWLKDSAEPKRAGFKWVVWDSISIFQDRALSDDIMVDAVAENPRQDPDVPSKREYMISQQRIGRFVRQFCDLPFNFGTSAHVMDAAAPGGDGMIFLPSVQGGKGQFSVRVCGYMNVVGYLHKASVDVNGAKKQVQRLQVRQMGKVYAKDRFNWLPGSTHKGSVLGGTEGFMDKPTIPKIDAAIEEWRKEMKASKAKTATPPSPTRSTQPTKKAS